MRFAAKDLYGFLEIWVYKIYLYICSVRAAQFVSMGYSLPILKDRNDRVAGDIYLMI